MTAILRALGGEEIPTDLADDLRCLMRLPADARAKLWQVLRPCLAEKITDDTERLLDVFRAGFRLDQALLGRGLKGARFLLPRAAQRDVTPAVLAEDVTVLCPDTPGLAELLLEGYDAFRTETRKVARAAAIADHGKLLTSAKWRLDTVEASESGGMLRVPVVMLTLHYRDGAEVGRITLQAMPDMVRTLRSLCEQAVP